MRKSFVFSILGIFLSIWLAVITNLYINGTEDVFGNRDYGFEAILAWSWVYLLAIAMLASIFGIAIEVARKLGKKEVDDAIVKLVRRIVLIILVTFSALLGLAGLIHP